jgi:ubiquitin carboxyl-terminal hydrolase 7
MDINDNEEALSFYLANKSLSGKALKVRINTTNEYVGIINEGSTCYLNSLLQSLFYDLSFRFLILSHETTIDSPILIALQQLFARLQLSESSAISTADLQTAFGWTHAQTFEQHDIHELFSLLLDALGNCSADLGIKLSALFQGYLTGK